MRKLPLPRLLLLFLVAATAGLSAQVKGISYTISPLGQYNFWDSQSGLDDGFLVGGQLGLGFGENVELRASYLTDLGLGRDFSGVVDRTLVLDDRDVSLTRYGGEVRLNLGRSALLPFLTLGAGIQELELDGGPSSENIYASGGLGIVLSVADRFNLLVEGKNTAYNFTPVRGLLTDAERNVNIFGDDDFFNERMSNWSVGAGLTFYLGGRRPGQLTDVDRAYEAAFSDGFRGLSLILEPTLSRINFADELAYRDTYLGGANIGLDFGPYVGFRAFYLRSMDDGEINFDYDNMSVYGGDFRFRLGSIANSFSPFVTLGGGYINLDDDYVGRADTDVAPISQAFASGGAGLSLNLSRSFRLVGTYRALLTSGTDVEDLSSTDQIRSSNQWTAGFVIALGKKARRPDVMFTSTAERQMVEERARLNAEKQEALAEQAKRNAEQTRELRESYEARIIDLQQELQAAYDISDTERIDSLEATIAKNESVVAELEQREADLDQTVLEAETESNLLRQEMQEALALPESPGFTAPAPAPNGYFGNTATPRSYGNDSPPAAAPGAGRIVLTPAELEGLIEEIFEGLNAGLPPLDAPVRRQLRIERRMAPGSDVELEIERELAEEDVLKFDRDSERNDNDVEVFQRQQSVNEMEAQLNALRAALEEMTAKAEAERTERAAFEQEMEKSLESTLEQLMRELKALSDRLEAQSNMTDKERRRERRERDDN